MRDKVRETFFLAFSSLAEPVHGGPQRSRARRLLARRSGPLTARTAVKASSGEEKASFSRERNLSGSGGNYDR
jgi:hypothetical protein